MVRVRFALMLCIACTLMCTCHDHCLIKYLLFQHVNINILFSCMKKVGCVFSAIYAVSFSDVYALSLMSGKQTGSGKDTIE